MVLPAAPLPAAAQALGSRPLQTHSTGEDSRRSDPGALSRLSQQLSRTSELAAAPTPSAAPNGGYGAGGAWGAVLGD